MYRLLPEIAHEFPEIAVLDQLFNDEVHYPTNRHYAAYIDTTLVPSQPLADKLISEAGERADKVCVIPHGINIEEMTAPDATFDSSGLPESFRGKFLVSFFGRLSAEKSPADFVKIARHLRSYDEIRFLMTGEGQERASVLALIEEYELQDRIHVPGFVDNLRDLMALSDVVVVPSICGWNASGCVRSAGIQQTCCGFGGGKYSFRHRGGRNRFSLRARQRESLCRANSGAMAFTRSAARYRRRSPHLGLREP